MIRTINCEGSRRSSHTNARTDFLAIPRNGINQSVSHVRLDGREYKQAKELIIYSQRTLSVLTDLLPNSALYPMSKNTANIHEIISFPVAAPTIDSNGKMHDGILLHRIACNRHKHPNGLHTDRLHRPIFAPKNDAYDARKAKKHIEKDFVSILSGMDINKPDDAGQAGILTPSYEPSAVYEDFEYSHSLQRSIDEQSNDTSDGFRISQPINPPKFAHNPRFSEKIYHSAYMQNHIANVFMDDYRDITAGCTSEGEQVRLFTGPTAAERSRLINEAGALGMKSGFCCVKVAVTGRAAADIHGATIDSFFRINKHLSSSPNSLRLLCEHELFELRRAFGTMFPPAPLMRYNKTMFRFGEFSFFSVP